MVRVAQIGTGGWGRNHARVLSHLGALCAICDADGERCRQFSQQYSVRGYDSVDGLLDGEEFDAALVCTPTKTPCGHRRKAAEPQKARVCRKAADVRL